MVGSRVEFACDLWRPRSRGLFLFGVFVEAVGVAPSSELLGLYGLGLGGVDGALELERELVVLLELELVLFLGLGYCFRFGCCGGLLQICFSFVAFFHFWVEGLSHSISW